MKNSGRTKLQKNVARLTTRICTCSVRSGCVGHSGVCAPLRQTHSLIRPHSHSHTLFHAYTSQRAHAIDSCTNAHANTHHAQAQNTKLALPPFTHTHTHTLSFTLTLSCTHTQIAYMRMRFTYTRECKHTHHTHHTQVQQHKHQSALRPTTTACSRSTFPRTSRSRGTCLRR